VYSDIEKVQSLSGVKDLLQKKKVLICRYLVGQSVSDTGRPGQK